MGRKPKKQRTHRRGESRVVRVESARSEAVTVGWMLATLATVLGLSVSAATSMLHYYVFHEGLFLSVSRYLLFTSAITGALSIALVPVVRSVRPDRPPLAIECGAVMIGVIPWVWLVWVLLTL